MRPNGEPQAETACFIGGLEFAEWVALAKSDPESFEAARRGVILEAYQGISGAHTCVSLQCELDLQRIRSGNGLPSSLIMQDLLRRMAGTLCEISKGFGEISIALNKPQLSLPNDPNKCAR